MVTIYSTPWCVYCHVAEKYLEERKVPYQVVDVSQDQKQLEHMVNISGQMGVPVIEYDGSVIVGFNRGALEALLRQKQLI